MHRFKNIGVVFDLKHPSSDVLAHAKELINTNNAIVHLLCVIPKNISEHQREKIEDSLKGSIGFDFSLRFVTENPVIEITRYTIEKKIDILLIGHENNEGLLNNFFQGSLTLSLMRKVPCPVWVAKRPTESTYQRILIAVDPLGKEGESVDPALNDKLIEIGTSYAKQQSAECFLVTAWKLEGEAFLQGPFVDIPDEEVRKMKDEEKMVCAKAFEKLQKRNSKSLTGCQTQMLHGEPGIAIPRFVAENNIDLIVLGTLARSGIQGFFIGNTAETIINQIDCSILAIKPDGFVSPVLP